MNLKIQSDCSNINWEDIPAILRLVGMGYHEAEVHRKAFENSQKVIFVLDDDKLIGFGRAISDGAYQAALYDVAILPEYQSKGIGKMIVSKIVEDLPGCNIILYAAIGKEKFYEKMHFRKMKTGMALFTNADRMKERGFTE